MKKMTRIKTDRKCVLIFALTLILIFMFNGCGNVADNENTDVNAQTQNEKSDIKFKTVTDAQLEYQVPKKWKQITGDNEAVIGTVTLYDTKDGSYFSVQTVTWEQIQESAFGEFYSNIDEFMSGEISSIKYSEGVSDISENNISVSDSSGISLDYTYSSDEQNKETTKQKSIIFVADGVFYRIDISNLTDNNQDIFSNIISSIKLK